MELVLTKSDFDSTVEKGVTLVDFWATWCGPCKMLAPTIEELAKDYDGKIAVGKVDVDENEELARRYDIYSIPTLIIFKDGKEMERIVGYHLKRELTATLDKYL